MRVLTTFLRIYEILTETTTIIIALMPPAKLRGRIVNLKFARCLFTFIRMCCRRRFRIGAIGLQCRCGLFFFLCFTFSTIACCHLFFGHVRCFLTSVIFLVPLMVLGISVRVRFSTVRLRLFPSDLFHKLSCVFISLLLRTLDNELLFNLEVNHVAGLTVIPLARSRFLANSFDLLNEQLF